MCEEKLRLLQALDEALAALRRNIRPEEQAVLELKVKQASEALNRHVAEHQC